jgi:hypothetical protein
MHAPAIAMTAASHAVVVIASTNAPLEAVTNAEPASPPSDAATWWAAPTLSLAAPAASDDRPETAPVIPPL